MVDKLGTEVGEQCASILEAAIAAGYPTPASKHDQCEHGKFAWEDCIACYDERLNTVAEQMRALSTPTQDTRNRVKVLEEFVCEYVRVWEAGTGTVYLIDRARTALGNKETDRHG